MKLENTYTMDIEINAFANSILGTGTVIYEVYTDGFNYEDELKFKNLELGAAWLAHSISKQELESLFKANVQNMMQDSGSFSFDGLKAVIQFNDDEINLITETMNNEGSINSIIDDLIMEDYEIVEKDSIDLDR